MRLPTNETVLLTDTVGFIQKLPTQLVASFRATLEELNEADLLLHVVDVSHANAAQHMETVERTLADLGVAQKPLLLALNKVDLLVGDDGERVTTLAEAKAALDGAGPEPANVVAISAERRWALDVLLRRIADGLDGSLSPES